MDKFSKLLGTKPRSKQLLRVESADVGSGGSGSQSNTPKSNKHRRSPSDSVDQAIVASAFNFAASPSAHETPGISSPAAAATPKNSGTPTSNGPSVCFQVLPVEENHLSSKPKTLILKENSISLQHNKGLYKEIWTHSADQVVSIAPKLDNTNGKRFTVQVLVSYEFEAEDEDQIRRIQDAFKTLTVTAGESSRIRAESSPVLLSAYDVPTSQSDGNIMHHRKNTLSSGMLDLEEIKSLEVDDPNEVRLTPGVTLKDFDVLQVVGEGSFGRVMKVKRKSDGNIFAMKMLHLKDYPGDPYAEHKILRQLDHPYIIKLHCTFTKDDKVFLCMDFMEHGDLLYHLQRSGVFTEEIACFYIAEMILAIDHLHRKRIVYRDLKPENVLLDSDGHIKLGDLGLAKQGITSSGGDVAQGIKAQTFCGTPMYLAPEILQGVEHGFAVDWWSVGIVFYEMLTGTVPFYSENRNEMYEKAMAGGISFPSHISKDAEKFIRAVLVKRPEDRLGSGRLGVYEIKSHAVFKNIDWKKLEAKQVKPPVIPKTLSSETPLAWDYGLSKSELGTDFAGSRSNTMGKSSVARRKLSDNPAFAGLFDKFNKRHSDSLTKGVSKDSLNAFDALIFDMERRASKQPEATTVNFDQILSSSNQHS